MALRAAISSLPNVIGVRVLFLTHNFPRHSGDAAGSFLLRLAIALRDEGVDVRVVAPAAAGLDPRAIVDTIDVVRFRYAPASLETLAYTGNMAADVARSWGARFALGGLMLAGAAAVRREARAWRADVVHAHWWFPSGLSTTIPGACAGRPLVITSHGSDVRLARGARGAGRLFARVAERAAAYTFVSTWLRDEASLMSPARLAERWSVAPMPIATERFVPPNDDASRSGLLFVGRLNAQKGVAELLEAAARQTQPRLITIVGDGPDGGALRDLAARLGIADRLRWIATVSQLELASFYAAAEALVMPSREEGLGLVAAESMLCETPVVAFASGGLTDIVANGETGLLAPPGDVDALATAMDRVVSDHALARRMGAAGRRFALARFAPSEVAGRYRAIYESAVASGRRAR